MTSDPLGEKKNRILSEELINEITRDIDKQFR